MKLKVEVTQEDIDRGLKFAVPFTRTCPIAQSFKRLGYEVAVSSFGCLFVETKEREEFIIATPYPAKIFIHAFDRGECVNPFSFEIDLEDKI